MFSHHSSSNHPTIDSTLGLQLLPGTRTTTPGVVFWPIRLGPSDLWWLIDSIHSREAWRSSCVLSYVYLLGSHPIPKLYLVPYGSKAAVRPSNKRNGLTLSKHLLTVSSLLLYLSWNQDVPLGSTSSFAFSDHCMAMYIHISAGSHSSAIVITGTYSYRVEWLYQSQWYRQPRSKGRCWRADMDLLGTFQ